MNKDSRSNQYCYYKEFQELSFQDKIKEIPSNKKRFKHKGYLYVRDNSSSYGWIAKHRQVMQEHLGKKLLTSEHVHHIDGYKLNNWLGNLCVMDMSEHFTYHTLKKKGLNPDLYKFVKYMPPCIPSPLKPIYKYKSKKKYIAAKHLHTKQKKVQRGRLKVEALKSKANYIDSLVQKHLTSGNLSSNFNP